MKTNIRTKVTVSILLLLTVGIGNHIFADEPLTARQIVEKVEAANTTEDRKSIMTMEIRRGGSTRVRTMYMWAKEDELGNGRSLIKFIEPADIRGTGFLTIENMGRDDDLWIYLPALKRVRRIASSGKSGSFMGSDFTYADMSQGSIDNYNYSIIGSESIDGNDCYKIEAVPATDTIKNDEGYSKKILWVRKDIFYLVKQEFYDKKGNYLKVMTQTGLKKIEGTDIWTASALLMTNEQKSGYETLIEFRKVEVNTEILDSFFTQRHLKRETGGF